MTFMPYILWFGILLSNYVVTVGCACSPPFVLLVSDHLYVVCLEGMMSPI